MRKNQSSVTLAFGIVSPRFSQKKDGRQTYFPSNVRLSVISLYNRVLTLLVDSADRQMATCHVAVALPFLPIPVRHVTSSFDAESSDDPIRLRE